MDTLLLIDAKNLVSATHFAHWPGGLVTDPDNLCVLCGILGTITNFLATMNPVEICICADHPSGCTARKELYPAYKGHRTKDQVSETYKHTVCNSIRDILPVCWAEVEGYEADDLIARITQAYHKKYQVIIVSNDGDLFQLAQRFPDSVRVYDHIKKQFMSHDDHPYTIEIMKSITGDTSDNIKSVTGKKTAEKIMEGKLSLDEVLDNGITRSEKLPRREVFNRNLRLVSLIGKYAILPKIDLTPFGIGESREFCFTQMEKSLVSMMPDDYAQGRFTWMLSNWKNWWDSRDIRINQRGVISWPSAQGKQPAQTA